MFKLNKFFNKKVLNVNIFRFTNLTASQKEIQNSKDYHFKMICLNTLLYTPFYISTLALNNFFPAIIADPVEVSRVALRSLNFALTISFGKNLTLFLTDFVDTANSENFDKKEFYKQIFVKSLPMVVSFLSTQVLLASNVLTVNVLNTCFTGILVWFLLNFLQVNNDTKKLYKIEFVYLLINLLFASLFYFYIWKNVTQGVNPFKIIGDNFRMENLKGRTDIIEMDKQALENENELIMEMSDKELLDYIYLLEEESKQ
jgi:HAMP domain-containing protein